MRPIPYLVAVSSSVIATLAVLYGVQRVAVVPVVQPHESTFVRISKPHRLVAEGVDRVIEIPEQVIVSPVGRAPAVFAVSGSIE